MGMVRFEGSDFATIVERKLVDAVDEYSEEARTLLSLVVWCHGCGAASETWAFCRSCTMEKSPCPEVGKSPRRISYQ